MFARNDRELGLFGRSGAIRRDGDGSEPDLIEFVGSGRSAGSDVAKDVILAIDQGTTGTTCSRGGRRAPHPRSRLSRVSPVLPAAGVGRARPGGAGFRARLRRGRVRSAGVRPSELWRSGSRISARRPSSGNEPRQAGRPRDRLAGPGTAERCRELPADLLRARNGLVPDPYFSATKLEWLLARTDVPRSEPRSGRSTRGSSGS